MNNFKKLSFKRSGKLFPVLKHRFSTNHHFSSDEYIKKIKDRFNSSSNISEINPLNFGKFSSKTKKI